jgi:hypothetical protein
VLLVETHDSVVEGGVPLHINKFAAGNCEVNDDMT